jgi:hypothetical protein
LQQAEFLVGQGIAALYGLTSVIFIGAFIYNGFIYILGYFPESKYWFAGATIENASEKMIQWVVAIIIVLVSYPLVFTIITFLIPAGSTCYDNLRVPGFTFFFPSVCTTGDTNASPTTPPPGGSSPIPSSTIAPISLGSGGPSSPAEYNAATRVCNVAELTVIGPLCSPLSDGLYKVMANGSYFIHFECISNSLNRCKSNGP